MLYVWGGATWFAIPEWPRAYYAPEKSITDLLETEIEIEQAKEEAEAKVLEEKNSSPATRIPPRPLD